MKEIKTNFCGLGWQVRLQQKKSSYFLTLVKEIVLGSALKRGDQLHYYLVNYEGRNAVLVFLDGEERPNQPKIRLDGTTFLVER